MQWWHWLLIWIGVSVVVGPILGTVIRRAEKRDREAWARMSGGEMTTMTREEEECEVTTLPKAWCQHCKVDDDVRRSHRLVGMRKRGIQPHDLT